MANQDYLFQNPETAIETLRRIREEYGQLADQWRQMITEEGHTLSAAERKIRAVMERYPEMREAMLGHQPTGEESVVPVYPGWKWLDEKKGPGSPYELPEVTVVIDDKGSAKEFLLSLMSDGSEPSDTRLTPDDVAADLGQQLAREVAREFRE